MSENSKIQWTDDTHNFWQGCTKISPGCAHCYAEARDKRFTGGKHWGPGAPRIELKDFDAPLRWNKKPWVCDECGGSHHTQPALCTPSRYCGIEGCQNMTVHRRRVFSLSLGDWLDPEVPIEWLADMLDVIRRCPNLDFLLLTKRPELWQQRIIKAKHFEVTRDENPDLIRWLNEWESFQKPPANIWIGATVENQEMADKRIPELLKIPAVCRFLSVEPMLEAIEFSDVTMRSDAVSQLGKKALDGISWCIVGGESGPGARPFSIEWARLIVNQCKAAGTAVFCKQMGSVWAKENKASDSKGGLISEFPTDLQIREFPCL